MKTIFLGNNQDWLLGMMNDVNSIDNASFFNSEYPGSQNSFLSKVFRAFVLYPTRSGVTRKLFYPLVTKYFSIKNNDTFILVFFDWNLLGIDDLFLDYLRNKYDRIKLVYIFTNTVRKSCAYQRNKINLLVDKYDLVYTFEPDDAKEFGFEYSQLFNAGFPFSYKTNIHNRVFFVGHSKDRLSRIEAVYNRLKELKIKCLFYVTSVPEDRIKKSNDFVCNQRIPYSLTQELEYGSTCILEILQGGAKGLTLKARSALCNDKLLITDNQEIKKAPFYNPNNILVFESPEDITSAFFENPNRVNYTCKDKEFLSLRKFIDSMKERLLLTDKK